MKSFIVRKVSVIVVVALIAFLLNIFLGDWLAGHIATWNWVKKYNLLEPRAPLVINTREEVRVNETNDIISALNRSQNKVAALVDTSGAVPELKASALAVTADGLFLTSKFAAPEGAGTGMAVVLGDGKRLQVRSIIHDPKTSLALIATDGSGLSVASFAARQDLVAGKRVLLLGNTVDGGPYFLATFLSSAEQMPLSVLSSDAPARSLPMQAVAGAIPGQVVVDLSGQVAGIWDGQRVVPASVLEETVAGLLAHSGKFSHPVFGFSYRLVRTAPAGGVAGLVVTKASPEQPAVQAGSAANKAGLLEGDVITKIQNQEVVAHPMPESLLTGATAGNAVSMEVMRAGKTVTVVITPN